MRVRQSHDVVQHHRHVAAQLLLNGHRPLGRKGHQPAVDVRAKDGLLFRHLDKMGQAEQLKSAAVGQDRSVPAHEAMQAAEGGHRLFAGPQGKMIGVAEDHFRPGGAELFNFEPLDAGLGADGHKGRHLHGAVRRRKDRPAGRRAGIGVQELEIEHSGSRVTACSVTVRSQGTVPIFAGQGTLPLEIA